VNYLLNTSKLFIKNTVMIRLANLLNECGDCERQGTDYTHGHDHEASMADSELRDMISNASKLQNIIQPGDELPGWVSAYISLAADYMHSVAEYMIGKQHEMGAMQQPTPGFAVVAESVDLKKVQAADTTVRNLMRNISTNSNISTADKQGLLQALGELQEFIDEVGYDSEIEDDEKEYASDYSKRRAQEKGY